MTEDQREIPMIDGEFTGFKIPWNTFWLNNIEGREIICEYEEEIEKYNLRPNYLYRVYGELTIAAGKSIKVSDIIDRSSLIKNRSA